MTDSGRDAITLIDRGIWIILFAASLLSGLILFTFMFVYSAILKWPHPLAIDIPREPDIPVHVIVLALQVLIYFITTLTLRKWYYVLGMLVLFPLVAYSMVISLAAGRCAFFSDCALL